MKALRDMDTYRAAENDVLLTHGNTMFRQLNACAIVYDYFDGYRKSAPRIYKNYFYDRYLRIFALFFGGL